MADVIGPVSTLPGHRRKCPEGQMCDTHPDRPAVVRIQGETDSFGAELHDLCGDCLDEIRQTENKSGMCDWCCHQAEDLRNRRDPDEGLYGRVYRVCGVCVKKEQDALMEEINDSH